MSKSQGKPNRLINETSPYLLQHAYNPVNWYPWGSEALERAEREDRVILLSIGYSACHWCHVMERESFESEATAKLMNENYVCIKVDREERPDLDKIYQTAHQLLTKRTGGWPLTVFITPDEHIPIYAGTYFPDKPVRGMMSFSMILRRITDHYEQLKGDMKRHNRIMKEAFEMVNKVQSHEELSEENLLMELAVRTLFQQYDPVYGGFGGAPKFPQSTQLEFLLAFTQREFEDENLQQRSFSMAVHTLDAMAEGGLRDQIDGGFCRYSVDDRWEIPHFEKMLYDNALLLPIYVDAGFFPGQRHFHDYAIQTANWLMREMQSPFGGYYSSLDADSEGEEGKFYIWSREELLKSLTPDEFRILEIRYGLRGTPNFEGQWHFRIVNSLETVAERTGFSLPQIEHDLEKARRKLFLIRDKRERPHRDEKILASWNGLTIKGMARAGRLLNRPDFIESAEKSLKFIQENMWKNGRLFATAKDDRAHLNAYLDDYVFLADGVLELLNFRWNDADMKFLIDLVEVMLRHFEMEDGGFSFTSDDHEKLLFRSIPTHDEATPSGNGVAVQVLYKTAYLIGDLRYELAAGRAADMLCLSAPNIPSAYGSLICGMEQRLYPRPLLVIRGEGDELNEWARVCTEVKPLQLMIYPIQASAEFLPGELFDRKSRDGTVAYLCRETSCSPPFDSLDELLQELAELAGDL